jgi:lambda repressor-like predicted transcriptional regulator
LPFKSTIQSTISNGQDGTQPVRGSSVVGCGGLGPTTDEPFKIGPKYQDTIMFFPTTKDRIFEICAPLYSQGMSLREIAKQIDLPRTTIKAALNAGGLPMRATTETEKSELNGTRPMKAGAVPYGYAYLEGRPVKEPKEYKVVLQIQSLWISCVANW